MPIQHALPMALADLSARIPRGVARRLGLITLSASQEREPRVGVELTLTGDP
jgi:hypothetical protein